MKQIYNPYLPLWEYVPDGEPHVFDGRVYIYGSHDAANSTEYCPGDYVTWSAPEEDLTDWRCEGVIYRRDQDPSNSDGEKGLWAPDVAKGPDGRYYLYYCLAFYPEIGVAVSDSPAGPFEFYGHVHYPEHIRHGKTLTEEMPFDPAVLVDDDGRVFLYYGFAPAEEKENLFPELTDEEVKAMPEKRRKQLERVSSLKFGEYSMVVEMEPDMVTVKYEPKYLIPGGKHTEGTGFEGHGFFEASSIRKAGEQYYFIYSSHKSHELCYAVSDRPDGNYRFGGTIISLGDIGLDGNKDPVNTLGNNHGGIVKINGEWYIFYHRQTNGTEFSRQGCAEKIQIGEDGKILQVELTSCGLNKGPLAGTGCYPAAIACHVTSKETMDRIDYNNPVMHIQTRITEQKNESYITAIKDGTVIGYKYFLFEDPTDILIEVRGGFRGTVTVSTSKEKEDRISEKKVCIDSEIWENLFLPLDCTLCGEYPLYFIFKGDGELDMQSISFLKKDLD